MLSLRQEFRHALRSLRRSPTSTCFIVATLGVCIAAVASVYAVADVVLVRGLPYRRPEQLIWIANVSQGRPDRPVSLPEFMDYRAQTTTVRIGAYTTWNGILESVAGAVRLQGLRMSGDGLAILGATARLGRLLTAADDAPGAPRVIVLGFGYWRRAFAGDPAVVGKTLTVNGERVTIVGVLPRFLPLSVRDIDAIVPLDPESDPRRHARNSVNFLRLFGRLAPSATAGAADRELNAIAARLREQFPTEYAAKLGVRVTPLQEYLAATLRPTLVILMACVSLMVAVALANVLNLLLARAVVRQAETAVRLALGASAPRIAAQLLTEGILLVGAGGIVGTGLAWLTISFAATLSPIVPRIEEARLGLTVLGLVIAVCGLAVLLFSLVPLLIARAVSPHVAFRGTRSAGTSPVQARLRASFVVAEVALALIITSAAGALMQSLIGLQRVELGYRPDSVFVARLSLSSVNYAKPADLARFTTMLEAALTAAPGVVAAGGASVAPLSGITAAVPFTAAPDTATTRRDWPAADYRAVSSGYLTAVGARRIAGRLIADLDDGSTRPVAVVNWTLAKTHLGGTGAVGRELLLNDNNTGPRTVSVVGIIDDLREVDLDGPPRPVVYIAMRQVNPDWLSPMTASQFWAVRLRSDAAAFAPAFLRLLREVDPAVASAGQGGMRAYVDQAIAPRRFSVSLLGIFTAIALLLTTLGVYGIAAYTVEQRRREIGVRIALGAEPRGIVFLMLGRTLRLATIGVLVGALGARVTGTFISRLMFGVSAGSPLLLAAVSALLLATAVLASWLPGRRAARIDPLEALSTD